MKLAKAHGLGNDFLLLAGDGDAGDAAACADLARRLCDRHRGIGADGLIIYGREDDSLSMRLLNADGGEAEISGNGLRCLAAWGNARLGLSTRHTVVTAAGPRAVEVGHVEGRRYRVATDLGVPVLAPAAVPVVLDDPREPAVGIELQAAGQTLCVTITSMGNPHCAVFGPVPPDRDTVGVIGAALEYHAAFPKRTNVEFVTVLARNRIAVRFWERGVGHTSASGTGAASAVVASILNGFTDRSVTVECEGGALEVDWPEGGSLRQVGEVELLFEADWIED